MSNIDRVRRNLSEYYEQSLQRRVALLEAWCDSFDAADDDQHVAIRRAAHQLHGSGASYGFPGISDRGAAVEKAPLDDLQSELSLLIDEVRSALAGLQSQKDL